MGNKDFFIIIINNNSKPSNKYLKYLLTVIFYFYKELNLFINKNTFKKPIKKK